MLSAFAQSASSSMSATESPPPETPTAPGQGAPTATIAAANRSRRLSGTAAFGAAFAGLAAPPDRFLRLTCSRRLCALATRG